MKQFALHCIQWFSLVVGMLSCTSLESSVISLIFVMRKQKAPALVAQATTCPTCSLLAATGITGLIHLTPLVSSLILAVLTSS